MQVQKWVLTMGIVTALTTGSATSFAESSGSIALKKSSQYTLPSEIVAYAKTADGHFVYSIGGNNQLNFFTLDQAHQLNLLRSIDLSPYGNDVQSVAAYENRIAVAVAPANKSAQRGSVVFFNQQGEYEHQVQVGFLPDMLTFNENATQIIVANEGEPSGDYQTDPEGSIGIIDLSTWGYVELSLNGMTTAAADGTEVRLGGTPSQNQAQDLEPEYITVAGDFAYVTLQENNAMAKVNLATKSIEWIKSYGVKSYAATSNNRIDIEEDGQILMQSYEGLAGLYMPDTITSITINGQLYLLTANEGDGREYTYKMPADSQAACEAQEGDWKRGECEVISFIDENEIKNLPLADSIAAQFETQNDLKVITDWGMNAAGEYEKLYTYGARSFSIWDAQGDLVYDSGDQLSKLIVEYDPQNFNQANGEMDGRSGNKGSEPEGIAVGQVGDRYYTFVGLERQSAIVVFDITNPMAPEFVQYLNTQAENNVSPEGMVFVAAEDAPGDSALLITAFEYAIDNAPQATVVYEIQEGQ